MLKARLAAASVLLGLLAVPLGAMATASPASALGIYGCKEVGSSSLGVYTESHCATTTSHGSWTWTWADENGETTDYCLLELTNPTFKNSVCTEGQVGGAFEAIKLPDEPYFLFLGSAEGANAEVFKGLLLGVKTEVGCTRNSFTGQPLSRTSISPVTFKYSGCTVKAPASCAVSSSGEEAGRIASNELSATIASTIKITFTPRSGETFLSLRFLGETCAIEGAKYEVKGKQSCNFSASVSAPAAEHTLLCEAAGSEFLLTKQAATLVGNTPAMFAGNLWWKIE